MRKVSTYNAWLNGIALSSVDASIIVRPAIEPEQKSNITYISNAGQSGRYIASDRRDSKIVQVRFSVKGLANLADRARVIDAVNGWAAAGGMLQISSRVDQQIGVTCIKYVTPSDIISPAGVYVLEFEANSVPYWQEIAPHEIDVVNSRGTGSGLIAMPGTVETVIEATITPTEGTLTEITLGTTNWADRTDYTFAFEGLSLAQDKTMTISYDALGILSIKADGVSVLDKRSADSDDDMIAKPGQVLVSFSADTLCTVKFSGKGRYR